MPQVSNQPPQVQQPNLNTVFNIIASGKKPTKIGEHRVFLSFPSPEEYLIADEYCEEAEFRARQDGFPTKEEMQNLLLEEGYLTKAELDNQKKLEAELKQMRDRIKGTKHPKMRESHLSQIAVKERILDGMREKESKFAFHTSDGKGTEIRSLILTRFSVLNRDGSKFWPTQEDMDGDTDIRLVNLSIPLVINFLSGIDTTLIRAVSKMPEWRTKWSAAKKTGNPMFEGPASNYDVNKLLLCYYSQVLDSVLEDPDCPEEKFLDDDQFMDSWLQARSVKWENERRSSQARSGGGQTHSFTFK